MKCFHCTHSVISRVPSERLHAAGGEQGPSPFQEEQRATPLIQSAPSLPHGLAIAYTQQLVLLRGSGMKCPKTAPQKSRSPLPCSSQEGFPSLVRSKLPPQAQRARRTPRSKSRVTRVLRLPASSFQQGVGCQRPEALEGENKRQSRGTQASLSGLIKQFPDQD